MAPERTTEDDRPGDVWQKTCDTDSCLVVVERFNDWSLVMRFEGETRRGVWPLRALLAAGFTRVARAL
jgi:hypothetical protein